MSTAILQLTAKGHDMTRQYKTRKPRCNPPYDCFSCGYDDCIRRDLATKEEKDFNAPYQKMLFTLTARNGRLKNRKDVIHE